MLESRTRGAGQTGRTTAHIMTWVSVRRVVGQLESKGRGLAGGQLRCSAVWHLCIGTLSRHSAWLAERAPHPLTNSLPFLPHGQLDDYY